MPTKNNPEFSVYISEFLEVVRNAIQDYQWNYEEVNRLDCLTQDYLHELELSTMSYQERAKIATALRNCRKQRRMSKDTVETLTPFIEFINSDRGQKMINLLKEALGQTRKVEEQMKTRHYRYRVLNTGDKL